MHKKFVSVFMCLLCIMSITGCGRYKGYTGYYPEFFTVATQLVPDAEGVIYWETEHQPAIAWIQRDTKGRRLFAYVESFTMLYLMVCQSSDDEYAYYYSENSMISAKISDCAERVLVGGKYPSRIEAPLLDFTDEQIEEVKRNNDWNKELDLEKCAKAKIIRKLEKK